MPVTTWSKRGLGTPDTQPPAKWATFLDHFYDLNDSINRHHEKWGPICWIFLRYRANSKIMVPITPLFLAAHGYQRVTFESEKQPKMGQNQPKFFKNRVSGISGNRDFLIKMDQKKPTNSTTSTKPLFSLAPGGQFMMQTLGFPTL